MASSIRHTATTAVLATAAAALVAAAPQGMEFARAQQANRAALQQYTWKSRTELKIKGETRKVALEQVRYDFDGRLQRTRIGGGSDESEAGATGGGRIGPIRKHIVANKKEAFQELMQELASLAGSYADLSQQRMKAFAAQADFSKGENGTVRIQARGVVEAGDVMDVWIDPASHMMRRVAITTTLDAKPVHLTADYRALENGLTYQARAVLRYPAKEVELMIENFEYQRAGTPR